MSNTGVNYQTVLEDLRARRDRLNHALAAIEQIIGETELKEQSEVAASSPAPSNIYRKHTIGDAAIDFIRSKGKKQSTSAIVKGLKAGGISSKSRNLYSTVYNTLTKRSERKNPDVVRDGTDWGLPEWKQERADP